ncbi:hypothetical protein [Pedobacter sp. SL55]|uniref:hypothetical protein n=1 Tax=Pedobacter sp. SL55 TaxID=2995161 RepID=UPI00226F09E2|nr:hypothetical protein [Pedobacter sp. SL55]WAC41720.1 hypothetical protein OVA16_04990 [Pedobacter sp. SL55]
MKNSLYNFYQFLKKPSLLEKQKDKSLLFKDFAALFLLDILFTALLVGLFYILLHFNLISEHEGINLLKEYGVWGALAFACILAPLLEEVFFRWHLRGLHGSIYFAFLSLAGLIASQITGALIQFMIVIISIVLCSYFYQFFKEERQVLQH